MGVALGRSSTFCICNQTELIHHALQNDGSYASHSTCPESLIMSGMQ